MNGRYILKGVLKRIGLCIVQMNIIYFAHATIYVYVCFSRTFLFGFIIFTSGHFGII